MGWASGGELAQEVWDIVGPHLPADQHVPIGEALARAFQSMDCDTLTHVDGPIGDAASRMDAAQFFGQALHPEEGARYSDGGDVHRFDGRRWVYVDDADEDPKGAPMPEMGAPDGETPE